MQESRRRGWLELELLPLICLALGAAFSGCAPNAARPNVAPSSGPTSPPDAASRDAATTALAGTSAEKTAKNANTATGEGSASSTPARAHADLAPASGAELPAGTLVLHVGDSFAAALGIPLGKHLKASGLRVALEFKTASYIPGWAAGPELRQYVGRYNPDLVLITLGANEIEIPEPPQRVGAIRRIVATVGPRPCVWISPPLWKKDTGLIEVLRQNVAPCRFLDSDSIVHDLPRAHDKIHPSTEGREIWADAVLTWLRAERDIHGEKPWSLRPERSAKGHP
jgi:hypothetical protein